MRANKVVTLIDSSNAEKKLMEKCKTQALALHHSSEILAHTWKCACSFQIKGPLPGEARGSGVACTHRGVLKTSIHSLSHLEKLQTITSQPSLKLLMQLGITAGKLRKES